MQSIKKTLPPAMLTRAVAGVPLAEVGQGAAAVLGAQAVAGLEALAGVVSLLVLIWGGVGRRGGRNTH